MSKSNQSRIVISGFSSFEPDLKNKKNLFQDIVQLEQFPQILMKIIPEQDFKALLPNISIRCVDRLTIISGITINNIINQYKNSIQNDRTGIIMGTSIASAASIVNFDLIALENGPGAVNPMMFPNTVSNAPTSRCGIWFKLTGPNITISNGMVSSLNAIGMAFNEIRYNEQIDGFFTGGAEELSPIIHYGYSKAVHDIQLQCGYQNSLKNEILTESSAILYINRITDTENHHSSLAEIIDFRSYQFQCNQQLAQNVVAFLNDFSQNENIDPKQIVYCTNKLPNHPLLHSILNILGDQNVIFTNYYNDNPINYLGVMGAHNIISLLKNDYEDQIKNRTVIVFNITKSGLVSALMLNKM